MAPAKPLVVLSTFPTMEVAATIARSLVESGRAACVNIVPVRSIYKWQGEVMDEGEVLGVIKTTTEAFGSLQRDLVADHPYDCPEVIALPIERGHPPYLDWLAASSVK